jgi:endoglucanase
MTKKAIVVITLILALGLKPATPASGQDLKALVKDYYATPSVTGNEQLLAMKVKESLPRRLAVEIDNLGSIYARAGEGKEELCVLASLDEFGWVISGVMPDGYLRLDRPTAPPHALYDSFLLGHAVMISTKTGIQNGIIAQPAMHLLTRERRDELAKNFSLDLVFLDIGARSEEEVKARGIEYLDPVTFRRDLAVLANEQWAGPSLGQKAVCAALAAAARETGDAESPVPAGFVWMAQTRMMSRGTGPRTSMGAARAKNTVQASLILLLDVVSADRGENSPLAGHGPVLLKNKDAPSRLGGMIEAAAQEKGISLQNQDAGESPLTTPFFREGKDVVTLALPVKFSQTPSEIINLKDVQALVDIVVGVVKKGSRP